MRSRGEGCRVAYASVACSLLVVVATISPAFGEGGDKRTQGGDWGANRRVRTTVGTGYVGVSGTFTVNAPISVPIDEKGDVSLMSNPFNCGYSFYLGGGNEAGLEVDAGLQWLDLSDQEDMNDPGDLFPYNPSLVGWAAFINNSGVYTSPKFQFGEGFLPWRSNSTQPAYTLTYLVTADGYLGLTIDGPGWPGGTVYWRGQPFGKGKAPDPDDMVWPSLHTLAGDDRNKVVTEFSSLYVKRSIAITQKQAGKGDCDGTQFDCTFSGGKVIAWNHDTQEWECNEQNWEEVRCDQSVTGYDVDEFGSGAIDRTFNGMATPDSDFKLAFPQDWLGKPARHAGSESIKQRYGGEEVHISLINGAWADDGSGVQPSPR